MPASHQPRKWLMALPPEGAARQVGEKAWDALSASLPASDRKLFDTKAYLDGFDKLLKTPSDDMVVDLMNQGLIVQCLDFEATHVLVLALSPVTRFTLNLLRRRGVTLLHWFFEDYREAKYWPNVLPAYHHFLAIQRGPLEAACNDAVTRFHYVPTAAMLDAQRPVRAWKDRNVEIVFVGFPSAYRIVVLEALIKTGLPLRIAGAGWDKYRGPCERAISRKDGNGWIGPEETYALLEASRIGLHLPSEDPEADRGASHVSPRVFDILAAGCLLLSEETPLVRESLRGCFYREFRGPEGAVQAARAALTEGITEVTVTSNRSLIAEKHTYARRMAEILALP